VTSLSYIVMIRKCSADHESRMGYAIFGFDQLVTILLINLSLFYDQLVTFIWSTCHYFYLINLSLLFDQLVTFIWSTCHLFYWSTCHYCYLINLSLLLLINLSLFLFDQLVTIFIWSTCHYFFRCITRRWKQLNRRRGKKEFWQKWLGSKMRHKFTNWQACHFLQNE